MEHEVGAPENAFVPSRRPALLASLAAAVVLSACQVVQAPQPATTAAPTTPAPTQTLSRQPTPAPTPTPEQIAIRQFVERVTAGKFRYRATFRGTASSTITIIETRGTLNVVGPNYGLVADFSFPGQGRARVEHRVVGGKAWVRYGGGRWTAFKGFIAELSMSPFAAIVDTTDVELVEVIRSRGQPDRYRVAVPTGFFHPGLIPAYNLGIETLDDTELELVIDAKGVPLSGTATIVAHGRVSGQLQEIVVASRLSFSHLGSKRVVVRAP